MEGKCAAVGSLRLPQLLDDFTPPLAFDIFFLSQYLDFFKATAAKSHLRPIPTSMLANKIEHFYLINCLGG